MARGRARARVRRVVNKFEKFGGRKATAAEARVGQIPGTGQGTSKAPINAGVGKVAGVPGAKELERRKANEQIIAGPKK